MASAVGDAGARVGDDVGLAASPVRNPDEAAATGGGGVGVGDGFGVAVAAGRVAVAVAVVVAGVLVVAAARAADGAAVAAAVGVGDGGRVAEAVCVAVDPVCAGEGAETVPALRCAWFVVSVAGAVVADAGADGVPARPVISSPAGGGVASLAVGGGAGEGSRVAEGSCVADDAAREGPVGSADGAGATEVIGPEEETGAEGNAGGPPSSTCSGSIRSLYRRTSKCRCGPDDLPVLPA